MIVDCYPSADTSDSGYDGTGTTDYCLAYGVYVEDEEEEELLQPDPWPFPLPEVMCLRGGTKPPGFEANARPDYAQRKVLRCNRKGIGLRVRSAK
jgi:hypothetical protein